LYPDYKFDVGSKADPEWSGYLDFLYPSPQNMEVIQNRRVIESLEKNGDHLAKARYVDHWLYFKSEDDRKNFLSKVVPEGFEVIDQNHVNTRGEFVYQLNIKRMDKVDFESVNTMPFICGN